MPADRNLRLLTIPLLATLAIGCGGGRSFDRLLDAASAARLAALDGDARVLASLHGAPSPHDRLPRLAEGSRVLGRTDGGVLLDVTQAELQTLARLDGLTSVTVWGHAALVSRLESRLRFQMLQALDGGAEPRATALPVIATFGGEAALQADRIVASGGQVRSTVGSIATIDAPVDAILRIAALPDVRELEQPSTLRPLGQ